MLLHLLRHADALDRDDDAARPLSPQGHRQVDALADFLKLRGEFNPEEIWHSPLVRARETATRLAGRLRLLSRLTAAAGLAPDDDPTAVVGRLERAPAALAIVGHEPHLSGLASLLIAGSSARTVFLFRKCAIVTLEGVGHSWVVRWHITPELLLP